MSISQELNIMHKVYEILQDVEPGARYRIMQWVVDRYEEEEEQAAQAGMPESRVMAAVAHHAPLSPLHTDPVLQVIENASVRTNTVKVLLMADALGGEGLSSREINRALKQRGQQVNNITSTINSLKRGNEIYIEEDSQNSRHLRVTDAGRERVAWLYAQAGIAHPHAQAVLEHSTSAAVSEQDA